MSKKLFIKTYGCQMNVYDSDKIIALLKPFGYTPTEDPNEADLAILNTCHIREKAEHKVFSDLGRLHIIKKEAQKNGKDLIICVGGCVAQAEGQEIINQAPYVSLVFGPQTYHNLPELLAKIKKENGGENLKIVDIEFQVESKFDALPESELKGPSTFLTIQEGCDKFCAFCVVPYTRGSEYSRPVKEVFEEAKSLVSRGAKEIVLLGQNVNAYHGAPLSGDKEWGLGNLIEYLAEQLPDLKRIRYTTSHPRDMDDELIAVHKRVAQLMPYLHLPVQSGSNKILQVMNRKYTKDGYKKLVDKFREARPDIMIHSDIIVAHPQETDADHKETLDLINSHIDGGYVFKYSPRPGTPSSAMDQIDPKLAQERFEEINALLNMKQFIMNQGVMNKILDVLIIDKTSEGLLLGKTPYNQNVFLEGNERLIGQIIPVLINKGTENSLRGTIQTIETESKNA